MPLKQGQFKSSALRELYLLVITLNSDSDTQITNKQCIHYLD